MPRLKGLRLAALASCSSILRLLNTLPARLRRVSRERESLLNQILAPSSTEILFPVKCPSGRQNSRKQVRRVAARNVLPFVLSTQLQSAGQECESLIFTFPSFCSCGCQRDNVEGSHPSLRLIFSTGPRGTTNGPGVSTRSFIISPRSDQE